MSLHDLIQLSQKCEELEKENKSLRESLAWQPAFTNEAQEENARLKRERDAALSEMMEQARYVDRLRAAIEELRDAACTAVNWKAVIEAQVGDAPWISQGDANEVELAVLKANEALAKWPRKE